MDGRANQKILLLVIDRLGDRAVRFSPESSVSDLIRAIDGGDGAHRRAIEVRRTGQTVSPRTPLQSADIRSGDLIRIVDVEGPDGIEGASVPPTPAATLHMLSGTMVGETFELPLGSSTIGRVSSNDVVIVDPGISRHHASITVTNSAVTIVDNGSTNGIMIEGRLIDGETLVHSGQRVLLGHSWVAITYDEVRLQEPDTEDLMFDPAERELDLYPERSVVLPAPPDASGRGRKRDLLPSSRSQRKLAIEQFYAAVDTVTKKLSDGHVIERRARLAEAPSIEELLRSIPSRDMLWTRQVADPDGLEVRVGLATLPSRTELQRPVGGSVDLRALVAQLYGLFSNVESVPALVDLREAGSIGMHGPAEQVRNLAYAMVGQLISLHGPKQLGIVVRNGHEATDWDWVKWLPHTDLQGSVSGADDAEFTRWLSSLLDEDPPVVDAVLGSRPPAMLIIIDDDRPLPPSVLTRLMEDGPRKGIYTMVVAADSVGLEEPVGHVLRIGAESASLQRPGRDTVGGITIETCDRSQVTALALRMAPIRYREGPAPHEPWPPSPDAPKNPSDKLVVTPFRLGCANPEAEQEALDEAFEQAAEPAVEVSEQHEVALQAPPSELDAPPVDPAPVDSGPLDSEPVNSGPVDPAPVDPAPVDSGTIDLADRPSEASLEVSSLPHGTDDARIILGTVQVEGRSDPAVFAFNLPRDGSLGLVGDHGSGKTTALRTVAVAAALVRVDPTEIPVVYVLDVRGQLEGLRRLPHVIPAIRNDIEAFRSVVADLERLVTDRLTLFELAGVDTLPDHRRISDQNPLRRVLVVIDELEALVEMLDSLHPGRCAVLLTRILEHGPRLGIHLVFSTTDESALDAALADAVGRWLILGRSDRAGRPVRPGRARIGSNEVRFATIGADGSPDDAITELADRLLMRGTMTLDRRNTPAGSNSA